MMRMTFSPSFSDKLRSCAPVSMLCLLLVALCLVPRPAGAHEVSPAIADMTRQGAVLEFTVAANLEAFVARIDLEGLSDTSAADSDGTYDALRALPEEALAEAFRAFWPEMAEAIVVRGDGTPLALSLVSVEPGPVGDTDLPRPSILRFDAALPAGVRAVEVGWAPRFGDLVLRQQGVEAPYTGYLEPGLISDPIEIGGAGADLSRLGAAVVAGIDRILPFGPDHAALIAALALLAQGTAGAARLGLVWGAGAVPGLVAAAGLGLVPGAALGAGLVGAGLIVAGSDALLRGPAAPGRMAGVAALGLVQGAVLARDPTGLRALDPSGDPLTMAGTALGVLVAALAVVAVVHVLTAPPRGRASAGLWAGLALIPAAALALTLGAGPTAARAGLPLAALAAALLALPSLAGSPGIGAMRRTGGGLATLTGAFLLAQALTGIG
jgi:hypothetical protein